jgi:hypothetical protein
MITLTTRAADKGTCVLNLTFKDAAGVAMIPSALTWTLMVPGGTVVNSRSNVVATPAASVAIVLSGEDLDYTDGNVRVLLVQATYTSTEGAGLPLKETITFTVDDLLGVT